MIAWVRARSMMGDRLLKIGKISLMDGTPHSGDRRGMRPGPPQTQPKVVTTLGD